MTLDIVSRTRWGAAKPKPMTDGNRPTECFIHHSENAHAKTVDTFDEQSAAVRGIQDFHMGPDRGWSDIGYHYVVFQTKPRVFQGRSWFYVPAAQQDHNAGTLAICVYGDGRREEIAPHTRFLIEQIIGRHPSILTIGGHRDVVSTVCPGDHFYSAIPRIARACGIRQYPY